MEFRGTGGGQRNGIISNTRSHYFQLVVFLLTSLVLLSLKNADAYAFKPLVLPEDLLPALPHSISWPLLRTFHSAVDLLPKFVGGVKSENDNVTWKGACFYDNEAWFEFLDPPEEGKRGGGVVHIKVKLFLPFLYVLELDFFFFCCCCCQFNPLCE